MARPERRRDGGVSSHGRGSRDHKRAAAPSSRTTVARARGGDEPPTMAPSRTRSALSSAAPRGLNPHTIHKGRRAGLEDDQGLCRGVLADHPSASTRRRPSLRWTPPRRAPRGALPTPSRAKVDWKRRSSAGFMILRTTTASFSPSSLLRCASKRPSRAPRRAWRDNVLRSRGASPRQTLRRRAGARRALSGRRPRTCVEIKFSRHIRSESSRRPSRHRRDACSVAWRCRWDGSIIVEK